MRKDKIELNKKAYNNSAEEYNQNRVTYNKTIDDLEIFVKSLTLPSKVLDAGCGAGVPVAKYMVEHGIEVTGIDISEGILEIAKKNVPGADFKVMDLADLKFENEYFDGIVAFYSIIHVPREEHKKIFDEFHRILKKDGLILVTMGSDEWEGEEVALTSQKMFWSHYSPEVSKEIVVNSGFEIINDAVKDIGDERHYWILARKK